MGVPADFEGCFRISLPHQPIACCFYERFQRKAHEIGSYNGAHGGGDRPPEVKGRLTANVPISYCAPVVVLLWLCFCGCMLSSTMARSCAIVVHAREYLTPSKHSTEMIYCFHSSLSDSVRQSDVLFTFTYGLGKSTIIIVYSVRIIQTPSSPESWRPLGVHPRPHQWPIEGRLRRWLWRWPSRRSIPFGSFKLSL